MPSAGCALNPSVAAIDASAAPPSRCEASMANVELHDTAKAVCRLVVPRCSLLSLWKVRPPMVTWLGHCTALAVRSPALASAHAVTTLNAEPGGHSPWSARAHPPRPPPP